MRAKRKALRHLAIVALTTSVTAALGCANEMPEQPAMPMEAAQPLAATEPVVSMESNMLANRVNDKHASARRQREILETIRRATVRYHRVENALAAGYQQASACEGRPDAAIGIHYRRASLTDTIVDPKRPEVLVYEPRKNGKLELVSVAFIVPAAAWDSTHAAPPMLGNQVFDDKRTPDDLSPPFPTYVLHVWVWKHNPSGMYAQTNPRVTCKFATQ